MTEAVDQILAALADPVRRRIVDILRAEPMRAGDLAEQCRISPPAMSRHLRRLRQSGLIAEREVEGDARVRLYYLRPEAFGSLREWLAEVEAFWGQQLDAFKTHIETKSRMGR